MTYKELLALQAEHRLADAVCPHKSTDEPQDCCRKLDQLSQQLIAARREMGELSKFKTKG